MPLKAGDVVTVIDKSGDSQGWWKAFNGQRVGFVPKDFVQEAPRQQQQQRGSSRLRNNGGSSMTSSAAANCSVREGATPVMSILSLSP